MDEREARAAHADHTHEVEKRLESSHLRQKLDAGGMVGMILMGHATQWSTPLFAAVRHIEVCQSGNKLCMVFAWLTWKDSLIGSFAPWVHERAGSHLPLALLESPSYLLAGSSSVSQVYARHGCLLPAMGNEISRIAEGLQLAA